MAAAGLCAFRRSLDRVTLYLPYLPAIHPIITPPTAPLARIGAIAFVIIASGKLISKPRNSPAAQPGHGNLMLQITNPSANRAINAPSIAARLSGNVIGIIIAVSTPPKISPHSTPNMIFEMEHLLVNMVAE